MVSNDIKASRYDYLMEYIMYFGISCYWEENLANRVSPPVWDRVRTKGMYCQKCRLKDGKVAIMNKGRCLNCSFSPKASIKDGIAMLRGTRAKKTV